MDKFAEKAITGNMKRPRNLTVEQIRQEQINYIAKVFGWMAFALAITGIVAWWAAERTAFGEIISDNSLVFWGLVILELICVFIISASLVNDKINSFTATLIFIVYSALNGLTLSGIFLIFTASSIALAFFVTAGTFALMSIFGYFTKKDLTSAGNLALMGLLGLIVTTVVNTFYDSTTLNWITTYAGIIIFVVLTAYDTQKIKKMNIIGNEGTDEDRKEAIIGALNLYLDFLNLFLKLLKIFGKRK
ncbi:MAG: Inner membrane protein YbhL [Bacteroidetes bacterium ADurb.Bin408]|nr:MAG: Inner membrane protein YbhL [Bacteroidetes bacterium ADurb.Bin408]